MTYEEYQELQTKLRHKSTHNGIASFILILLSFATVGVFILAANSQGLLWWISQLLVGFVVLKWFFLIHDLGHNHYFSWKPMNAIVGHIASLIVILPFYPWRYIHRAHHLWTGWKDKDPTMTVIIPKDLAPRRKAVVNFCWKYWIPIFTVAFSFSCFFNYGKLRRMFPEKNAKNIFSILLLFAFHLPLMIFTTKTYFQTWGVGYFIFLFIADPILLSQHVTLPFNHTHGKNESMLPFWEQETYTRTLIFPRWIKFGVFLGFEAHNLHHLFPTKPGYRLSFIEHTGPNDIYWTQWLRETKKLKAVDILFSEELNLRPESRSTNS